MQMHPIRDSTVPQRKGQASYTPKTTVEGGCREIESVLSNVENPAVIKLMLHIRTFRSMISDALPKEELINQIWSRANV